MPKSDFPFDPDDYAPVAERIALFYARHPEGRIVTELLSPIESAEVVVRACVYRAQGDTLPAATGLAAERKGDGEVNAVACLENTETSAIGRALANLGLTAARRRPSAEEMRKAMRGRAAPAIVREGAAAPPTSPADVLAGVLTLLRAAERHGLPPRRAVAIQSVLLGAQSPPVARLERLGRRLRQWLAFRKQRHLARQVPRGSG